ncbi:MAG TPA: ABC-F family ATP-binding cassette domain-containing protein [bacterium]|nr:ABC-F family ATP-binding cassette domain-containing protein [bacterium]
MFQLSGLSKSFGGRVLFQDVTWQIMPGDRWGLVGPNGVGKTTLLKCFAGTERADTGTITRPKGSTLGYLAQEVRRSDDPDATVLAEVIAAQPAAQEIEAEMRRLEEEMASIGTSDPMRAEALAHLHGDLQDRFHAMDGFSVETRAKEILAGLGFRERDFQKRLDALSGGWGMRVQLARLLLARPDILLLDEPTNHLDLESVVWLEQFLADYAGAWVVVSHDRYFLNRMVDGIAELNRDGIALYAGSYDDYLEEREERLLQIEKAAEQQAKKIADMERFIERFRYKATKARQAQSRLKQLAKIERVEAPKRKRRTLRIRLPDPPRSGEVAITLERAAKRYGDNVIYTSLDFELRRGERVALVGPNGAGKSTLLKILAGVVPLDGGNRRLGHNGTLYYYAQHQTEVLDPTRTVLQEIRESMPLENESTVRGLCGAFLFSGDDVDKKISVLSGGEKARVALAKMLAKPANLLLLDEPTNHLDLASREVLESALANFPGTIVFISHDRYFINSIATKIVEVRRPEGATQSKAFTYAGDYDYWQWKTAQEAEATAASGSSAGNGASAPASTDKDDYERRKAARRDEEKRRKEVERLEKEIEATEGRVREIDALLADPAVFADAARCKSLMEERTDLEEKLGPLLSKWEQAAAE